LVDLLFDASAASEDDYGSGAFPEVTDSLRLIFSTGYQPAAGGCDCHHVGSGLLACRRPFGRRRRGRDSCPCDAGGVCAVERDAAREGGGSR